MIHLRVLFVVKQRICQDVAISKCKKINYCSREHQVQHWERHQIQCIPYTNFQLDEISPPLISNIASFLNQKEYPEFERVNRKIFIGCHSPYSLTEIVANPWIMKRFNEKQYKIEIPLYKIEPATSLAIAMDTFNDTIVKHCKYILQISYH